MVPVVYGLGNYSAVAPPHSFINVLDFAGPAELAAYLKYLDGNDTAYNEYFRYSKSRIFFYSFSIDFESNGRSYLWLQHLKT